MSITKKELREYIMLSAEVLSEIQKEKGIPFTAENVSSLAITLLIQDGKKGSGNGKDHGNSGISGGGGSIGGSDNGGSFDAKTHEQDKLISIKQRIALESILRKRLGIKGKAVEDYLRTNLHVLPGISLDQALSKVASQLISNLLKSK